MPTLNAPQSATYVTASPQEFVNVICTGATDVMLVSWVGPAGTSGQRTVRNTTSAGEDIGPLLDGTTVTFLAQAGAPVYSAPAFSPPVQSLVSEAGKSASAALGLFSHVNQTPTTGFTPHMQWPALGSFYGIRAGYVQRQSSGVATLNAMRAAAPTIDGANSNTLTWSNALTWSGSSTPTFPAAAVPGVANDIVPDIYMSDILFISSKARTDIPTEKPLLQTVISASTAMSASACDATSFAEILAASGLRFRSRINTSDMTATPGATSSTPSAAGTWVCPQFIEFLYDSPSRLAVDVGDSRNRGQIGATVTNGYNSIAARVCWARNARSSARIWSPLSFSITGQKHNASYQTGLKVVAALRPDVLIAEVYSANDTPITQASVDQAWAETVDLQRVCNQYGTKLVVKTAPAFNRAEGEDVFRRALNNRLRASGLTVADVAAALDDATNPNQLSAAANSGDNLHLTEWGYGAEGAITDAAAPNY